MTHDPRVDLIEDPHAAAEAAATHIVAALGGAIASRGAASFVATGGRTPGPVYAALREAPLDWSRVTVTLSDERWVDEDSPDSNGRLVREALLIGRAAPATFIPLKTDDPTPEAGAAAVEGRLAGLPWPLDMVMLGMGEDGHVASLFPRNPALPGAMDLASARRCSPMAVGPDGLPPLQPRMSLTMAALTSARGVLIYVSGAEKRAAVQRALSGDDIMEMPVRALLRGRAPVRVICAG